MNAVTSNDSKTVKILLEQGIDPNITEDEAYLTPLHYAVLYEALDIIPLLVAAGAKIDNCDSDGITPFEIAKIGNNEKIVKLLNKLYFLTSNEHENNDVSHKSVPCLFIFLI